MAIAFCQLSSSVATGVCCCCCWSCAPVPSGWRTCGTSTGRASVSSMSRMPSLYACSARSGRSCSSNLIARSIVRYASSWPALIES
uniref:Putative secreted protein n=1 Tax=Anopheles darlingi TaxID=43151 RepID=A0A2M4DKD2_ANODA